VPPEQQRNRALAPEVRKVMISLGITNINREHPPGTPPIAELPAALKQVISEASAWCSLEESLKCNLRSAALDPSTSLSIPWNEDIHVFVRNKYESYQRAVEEVSRKRSALLNGQRPIPEFSTHDSGVRLLIYQPLETVDDGAAEASSKDFFDVSDAPPWDTWLFYSKGTIVSLVPESFVRVAQAGIDANPVDCIHWPNPRELSNLLATFEKK
jgi:hypothetical protein